jgi:hypothetical protein
MIALSIRQPWAWLIVNGHKPVENRTWRTSYRGPLLIHASKGMTRREFAECRSITWAMSLPIDLPSFEELERGGIVGQAVLIDCVNQHDSPFFFGPFGFVLADAKPLPFRPCKGQLGFFEVTR